MPLFCLKRQEYFVKNDTEVKGLAIKVLFQN